MKLLPWVAVAFTIFAVWCSPSDAGFMLGDNRGFTCKYEEKTTVLNEGDPHCLHEWVNEPTDMGGISMVPAVYCQCGCDFGNGGHKICRKCLRKIRTVMVGVPVPLDETEYEQLEKKLKDQLFKAITPESQLQFSNEPLPKLLFRLAPIGKTTFSNSSSMHQPMREKTGKKRYFSYSIGFCEPFNFDQLAADLRGGYFDRAGLDMVKVALRMLVEHYKCLEGINRRNPCADDDLSYNPDRGICE